MQSQGENQERSQSEVIQPEYVLIDERDGEKKYTHFGVDAIPHPVDGEELKQKQKNSVSLRFLCLLGLIFCIIFGFGMFLWSMGMTALAALSLFQNPSLNQGVKDFWKILGSTIISSFCLILGLLIPPVGLGLLVFYFSRRGKEDVLQRVFQSSFHRTQ